MKPSPEVRTTLGTGPTESGHTPSARSALRLREAAHKRLPRRWPSAGTTLAVAGGTILSLAPGLLPRTAPAQAVLTSVLIIALLAVARIARFARRTGSKRATDGARRTCTVHSTGAQADPVTVHTTGAQIDPVTVPLRRGPAVRICRSHSNPARGRRLSAPAVARSGTFGDPAAYQRRAVVAATARVPGTIERRSPGVVAAAVDAPDATNRRPLLFAAATAGVLGATAHAALWQNTLRDAMDMARTGPGYWLCWAAGTLLLTVTLVTAGSWIGRVVRRIGWSRGLVMAVVAGLPMALFGVPVPGGASSSADPALVRPAVVTRSGSAESMVSWASLGREGQRFVTTEPSGAVRVYVGLQSAPDLAARAELAVRELDRAGGFDRSHLVVAVPTGSGWVDARALRGFGARFGADVAVVALQYSRLPSWATFLVGRDSATASARALLTAVEEHIATLPDPPRLYMYGQSLGALGGSAVFAGAEEQNRRVCSVLWAGLPGGGGPQPGARSAVLANASDPVVHWSLDLLWRPPDLTAARRDAPTPGWLPVVSFVQTTADLLGALGTPPGHGHRYGSDQGTTLPACA
ncbi:alpha/beta-hydrolase family protein [Nocardia sp. NPDC051750]|uniref:alpha/beta-hydrolase family protein n=1 Tax=Nocardia sp. NPDC051750 TaxID=3364325 RepID=UPI0037B36E16